VRFRHVDIRGRRYEDGVHDHRQLAERKGGASARYLPPGDYQFVELSSAAVPIGFASACRQEQSAATR
jgi:hypothetical protein